MIFCVLVLPVISWPKACVWAAVVRDRRKLWGHLTHVLIPTLNNIKSNKANPGQINNTLFCLRKSALTVTIWTWKKNHAAFALQNIKSYNDEQYNCFMIQKTHWLSQIQWSAIWSRGHRCHYKVNLRMTQDLKMCMVTYGLMISFFITILLRPVLWRLQKTLSLVKRTITRVALLLFPVVSA